MGKLIDLTGEKFGRLVIIEIANKNKRGNYKWICLCDCGKEVVVVGHSIRRGHTKSCGCLQKEGLAKRVTKHGMKGTPTYRS